MVSTTECELLVAANQDYVFRFYQDCYNWNIWFHGIERSWFEQEPRPGIRGKVIFTNGTSWNLRVVTLHDDRIITIRARRWLLTMVFEAETEMIRENLTRVIHRVYFSGIAGFLCRLLWKKKIFGWLQTNIGVLTAYANAELNQQADQALAEKKGKRKTRKSKKSKKVKQ